MPGTKGISSSLGKKSFQSFTSPAPAMKQQQGPRGKEVPGRGFLSDQEMEGELQFCLQQLHCFEQRDGYRLRREIIQEMEQLVEVWVSEEAGESAQARLVSYGSYKLSVVDCESDLDLLCVVPSQVSRNSFFSSFYLRLQHKVRGQG